MFSLCFWPTELTLLWNGYTFHTYTHLLGICMVLVYGTWLMCKRLLIRILKSFKTWSHWIHKKFFHQNSSSPQESFLRITQFFEQEQWHKAIDLLGEAERLFPSEPYWSYLRQQIPISHFSSSSLS